MKNYYKNKKINDMIEYFQKITLEKEKKKLELNKVSISLQIKKNRIKIKDEIKKNIIKKESELKNYITELNSKLYPKTNNEKILLCESISKDIIKDLTNFQKIKKENLLECRYEIEDKLAENIELEKSREYLKVLEKIENEMIVFDKVEKEKKELSKIKDNFQNLNLLIEKNKELNDILKIKKEILIKENKQLEKIINYYKLFSNKDILLENKIKKINVTNNNKNDNIKKLIFCPSECKIYEKNFNYNKFKFFSLRNKNKKINLSLSNKNFRHNNSKKIFNFSIHSKENLTSSRNYNSNSVFIEEKNNSNFIELQKMINFLKNEIEELNNVYTKNEKFYFSEKNLNFQIKEFLEKILNEIDKNKIDLKKDLIKNGVDNEQRKKLIEELNNKFNKISYIYDNCFSINLNKKHNFYYKIFKSNSVKTIKLKNFKFNK